MEMVKPMKAEAQTDQGRAQVASALQMIVGVRYLQYLAGLQSTASFFMAKELAPSTNERDIYSSQFMQLILQSSPAARRSAVRADDAHQSACRDIASGPLLGQSVGPLN